MKKFFTLNLIIIGLALSLKTAEAFDETYTHPYLTRLLAEAWNKQAVEKLSPEEIDRLVVGSQAEDIPASRCLNHFYNPTNGEGLSLDGLIAGYAANEWINNENQQAEPLFGGSHTWGQAVSAYRSGDRLSAYTSLGHVLHLIEDMGVPAHTRNDEHLYGDGFESWVKSANSQEKKLEFDWSAVKPRDCPTINKCLEELAIFSNTNFFSDNTITSESLTSPWSKMTRGRDNYFYVNKNVVAFLDPALDRFVLNSTVFRSYWRQLAPVIVSYGWRVLDLLAASTAVEAESKERQITPKTRGQISAGGIKISAKAPRELKFNWPKPKIVEPVPEPDDNFDSQKFLQEPAQRFWPTIDLSQLIPWPARWNYSVVTAPILGASVVEMAPPVLLAPPTVNPNTSPSTSSSEPPTPPDIREPAPPPAGGDGGHEPPATTTAPLPDTAPPTVEFINWRQAYEATSLTVDWQGQDDQTSATDLIFDLDYKLRNADWVNWLSSSSLTTAIFNQPLAEEARIDFRLRAGDQAGNWSAWQIVSTVVWRPHQHSSLLYENLEHLYHFAECQDQKTIDSLGDRALDQGATWIDGRFGCGLRQGWLEREAVGVNWLKPLTTTDVTLSFFWRDVSDYPINYSRNRFVFFSRDYSEPSDYTIAILPTLFYTKVYVDGVLYQLAPLPADHNWHQLTLVVNGDYLAFYVDGEMLDQVFGDFSPTDPLRGLNIVGENSPSEFDELAIWSRSLSSVEIKDYYNVAEPLKPQAQF